MRIARLIMGVTMTTAALASLAIGALPVARHMAGVVSVEGASAIAQLPIAADNPPDLTPIFERAPFGRPASRELEQPQGNAGFPELLLKGVFSTKGGNSAALIDIRGKTGLFRQDERVLDDWILSEVNPAQVTLKDGAKLIILHLNPEDGDVQPDAETPPPAATAEDLLARLGSNLIVPVRYEKPKAPETTSEYIDYWRTRIRKNPQAVLDQIGLRPTEAGYVIAEQHDVGVRLAGLRSGDLVRSVNGQQVGKPDDDRRLYDRIAASGQARIEVERDGRVLTFSFPLR